ncbi:MAG TPA: serine/threonine-protein kinase, partial [Pseudomonadota bacterium]|nr:serine/threonine-protein kinase [Pseudomonadota bacterium]
MLASISEGVLLERARAQGLLSVDDMAAAQKEQGRHQVVRKWGPVLDLLIAQGKISDEAVRKLHASLQEQSPMSLQPALDRTMDGGLEHTMQSEAGVVVMPQVVSAQTYPAPHWDKYEFIETLGRGGMGAVYKARDRRLGRMVALKFIHGDDPAMIQRFLQEARAQARLDHPFICKVYEVGSVDNKPYIAMELVEGRTLDRASAGLDLSQKVQLLKDAAEALHAAHQQGIIHRDVKPSNIMVERTATGGLRPVIMDFGLARESGDSHGLTESGAVMGTPAYMSPEQARGEARRLDQRSDVYSLGATLYDVLLGKPPFEDQTVLNILLKVMNEPPTPLRQIKPDIPEAIELVVSKCLNKEPAQRYQTAKELADDLGRFLSAQKVEARRLSYSYRLSYWARNNRTLAALTFALLCSVIVGSGYGIRARFVAIQKERRAKEQSELSRRIGQSVKDIEWVARTAYLLPLHDASYEKQLVEQRMTEIETELSHHPEIGPRLLSYARGRGLLALHKWKESSAELRRAEQLGHVDLELDYAQGRALSALYSEALDEARKSGDRSFFEKRKAELDSELLKPALSYLERSRGLRTVSSTYVEGLIAFYQDRHDVALSRAEEAHKKAPWLYEAVQLAGDVFLTRARDQRDRGEHDQAEKSFAEAVARYRKAADIGRSDDSVYESLAETYIRWEELDYFRGRNPEDHLKEALAAADKALLAAKKESHGHTKKAFAYFFYADYAKRHRTPDVARDARTRHLREGLAAIAAHPGDPYAHETTGIAQFRLAESIITEGHPAGTLLSEAYGNFHAATTIHPRFPWAYNDH